MTQKLDSLEKEILRTISENPGQNHKSLHKSIGCPKSTLSVKLSDLREQEYIYDKEWKGKRSEFYIEDDVEIDTGKDWQKLLNKRVYVNALETAIVMLLLFVINGFRSPELVMLGWMIGFLPTFIFNIYTVVQNQDFYSINIEKKG